MIIFNMKPCGCIPLLRRFGYYHEPSVCMLGCGCCLWQLLCRVPELFVAAYLVVLILYQQNPVGLTQMKKCRAFNSGQALRHTEGRETTRVFHTLCFGRFSLRVFCSTPKNKSEFAGRLSVGRKYAKNESFTQFVEYQWLVFKMVFSAVQNAPFRHVIWPISGPETHDITP